jgi:hypothetical protein
LVGFITASLLQWAKDFLHWRRNFQAKMVFWWVIRRARRINREVIEHLRLESSIGVAERAYEQLENLAGAELDTEKTKYSRFKPDALAAYSLPAEQLCGQLAAAAELVVAAPEKFPELFGVLTTGSAIPAQDFREYIGRSQTGFVHGELSAGDQRYAELRAEFAMQAQRALDNLQIAIGERWRKQLTFMCLVISSLSAVLVVLYLVMNDPVAIKFSTGSFVQAVVTVCVITIAGALLAPVTHDLMRAIRAFRR